MTIADFCDMFNYTFQEIAIYSLSKEKEVYRNNIIGVIESKYSDCEIVSIDCQCHSNDVLTINIR